MAEFCKQCARELFGDGDEYNDAKAAYAEGARKYPDGYPVPSTPGKGMAFLCEGCGPTLVNHEGACILRECLRRHGEQED